MRICIFGAGAVGGNFGVRLLRAGHEVSLVARGENLTAMRRQGLTLVAGEEEFTVQVQAAADARELEPQDCVLVTTKATGLSGLGAAIEPLLNPDTMVVFAQNGIPWWYRLGLLGPPIDPPDLSWMDPDGELQRLEDRVIGAVVFSANEMIRPGVVRNNTAAANRLIVGEPDDSQTPRVKVLRAALESAGINSPATDTIRRAVWSKLVMNMTGSVLCAVTGASLGELRNNPAFIVILDRLHAEASAIARAHCPDADVIALPRGKGGHKPSILQDYERGRPMEIDALVTAPLAFARAAGLATPTLDLMGALAADKAARAGLYTPTAPMPVEESLGRETAGRPSTPGRFFP